MSSLESGFSICAVSARSCPSCAMNIIIFTALGLLACSFLIYVLVQWTDDKDRKPAGPPPRTERPRAASQKHQLFLVSRRPTRGKKDQLVPKSSRTRGITWESERRSAVCCRRERVAHERIARALISGRSLQRERNVVNPVWKTCFCRSGGVDATGGREIEPTRKPGVGDRPGHVTVSTDRSF